MHLLTIPGYLLQINETKIFKSQGRSFEELISLAIRKIVLSPKRKNTIGIIKMKSSFKKKETATANTDDGSKAYFGLPEFDDILLKILFFYFNPSLP